MEAEKSGVIRVGRRRWIIGLHCDWRTYSPALKAAIIHSWLAPRFRVVSHKLVHGLATWFIEALRFISEQYFEQLSDTRLNTPLPPRSRWNTGKKTEEWRKNCTRLFQFLLCNARVLFALNIYPGRYRDPKAEDNTNQGVSFSVFYCDISHRFSCLQWSSSSRSTLRAKCTYNNIILYSTPWVGAELWHQGRLLHYR